MIGLKVSNQRNHLMELCHNVTNTLTINIVILTAFILWIEKSIIFYLGVWDGTTGAYNAQSITTKSQVFDIYLKFIWKAECQSEKKLKYLYIDFKKNLPIKHLENTQPKRVLKRSWVHSVLLSKTK